MPRLKRLTRSFYIRECERVARELLGCLLVHVVNGEKLIGRIVETEAYVGTQDRASHAYAGRRTDRNEVMYARGGQCYVYFTYGMHHCANVVTGSKDDPCAVLIRALEPIAGIEQMHLNRSKQPRVKPLRDRDLCSGPAKLTQAMKIDRMQDGVDLVKDTLLYLCEGSHDSEIIARPRIGIDYAEDWKDAPLRFYLKDNPHVSLS